MILRFKAAIKAFATITFVAILANTQGQATELLDETAIATCVLNNVNDFKPYHYWDFEFEGYSSQEVQKMPSNGKDVFCGYQMAKGDHKSEDQDTIDEIIATEGKRKLINELQPSVNRIDKVSFGKFLNVFDHTFMDRSKPKGPNYFIIDNFARYFKLDKDVLLGAKKEVEKISDIACSDVDIATMARCDSLLWLEKIDTHG